MLKIDDVLTELDEEEKKVFYNFIAFPDFFSVDWFANIPGILPSQLISVINKLDRHKVIRTRKDMPGYYAWSEKVPLDEFTSKIPPEEMSRHYRKSIDILQKNLPENEESMVKIAHLCILAGVESTDLEIIFKAACLQEKNHKIADAVFLYEALLESINELFLNNDVELNGNVWNIFIRTIENRASLSLFHPNLKKVYRFLCMACAIAQELKDIRSQCSLQFLIGQNYWMSFQHEKAEQHFDIGWKMVNTFEDKDLYKRGLQMQGLSHWIRGNLSEAIQAYEESLGKLDVVSNDDFSLLTALHLALCYTQVGIPQRGLGITESIEKRARKKENWPLVACAMATTGIIFLEIRQIKNAKLYFEKSYELSKTEMIPMAEVMSGIGLADIECLEGRYESAAEYFKVLWKLRKSSWYHTLNNSHVFEAGYLLHINKASPLELNSVIYFLYNLKKENVNVFMFSIIRRHQIKILEEERPLHHKISELLKIEKSIKICGATLELAKIRIDLALHFSKANDLQKAGHYATKAWRFLKSSAKDVFPSELKHLLLQEDIDREDRLFDLVIEMGEALVNHNDIEELLTNIIMSISTMTRAERTALFIKEKDSQKLQMVASRNLTHENINDQTFRHGLEMINSAIGKSDAKIFHYETTNEKSSDCRHVIITPLKLIDKVIGVLYQDSRFFSFDTSPAKIKLLSALASQIAVSIDRAQAYDEISRLNEKLLSENLYYLEEKEEFRPFGEIIGTSDVNRQLHRLIKKVAPTNSTVLIQGETGVGKELIARAIHRESARHQGPFIRVNCAALPESLIDSELFGHEKGAFTGAVKTKPGRFELAHKGTIFLDEVTELPPSTQSRLLRILQEREFQRVGGTTTLHSDFRLISASNKELSKEVEQGNFRTDLFYRLNVFPIYVEPLRKRLEDIPLLAEHFFKRFSLQHNKHYAGITEGEMAKLMTYTWPGNIRELANAIERAVILGESKITFAGIDNKRKDESNNNNMLNIEQVERNHILQVLEKTRGKVGGFDGAAALLGLKRTTLIHRMRKLGINYEKS